MNLFCLLFYSSRQTNWIRLFVFWENLQLANLLFDFIWPLALIIKFAELKGLPKLRPRNYPKNWPIWTAFLGHFFLRCEFWLAHIWLCLEWSIWANLTFSIRRENHHWAIPLMLWQRNLFWQEGNSWSISFRSQFVTRVKKLCFCFGLRFSLISIFP